MRNVATPVAEMLDVGDDARSHVALSWQRETWICLKLMAPGEIALAGVNRPAGL